MSVLALGLIPTAIGHSLVQTAARRASPALVGLVAPGETVGSLAIGALVMGSSPTNSEAIGTAIILAGAILVAQSSRTATTGA